MERIAIILMIFILLMNGRHPEYRLPDGLEPLVITATPLPLDSGDPARRKLGALTYLGGWVLGDEGPYDFGGISSLHVDDTGKATALNDWGEVVFFQTGQKRVPGKYMPVPAGPEEPKTTRWGWDSESMAHDPATGRNWVGYELVGRICRYSTGFAAFEGCVYPPDITKWPNSTGIESLVRLPDGRFLAIAEDSPGPRGEHDVLLFAGDPLEMTTPRPLRLDYRAPEGYLPTDALVLSPSRLLVISRRVTLADGFTAVLKLVDISDLSRGVILDGPVVAKLARPIQHDNYEALAMSREDGRPVLWIASDDNHLFFQRSLLLKFAIPQNWFEGPIKNVNRSGS